MKSNCGRKHCPGFIVMLYDLAGVSTSALTRDYGIPHGTIDKLVKKGRLVIKKRPKKNQKQICLALIVMLYTLCGCTMREIAKVSKCGQKLVSRTLKEHGIKVYYKNAVNIDQFNSMLPDNVRAIKVDHRHATVQCLTCGHVYTRTRGKEITYECPDCKERIRLEAKKQRAEQRTKELAAKRAAELAKPKTCKECGKVFHSEYETAAYCSHECRRKAENRRAAKHQGHRKRARRAGVEYTSGITLSKLIERDGGICHICGQPIDEHDKQWGTSGPMYPSIDHVKPISKGGGHTWGNVRLAHCICNSIKGVSDLGKR